MQVVSRGFEEKKMGSEEEERLEHPHTLTKLWAQAELREGNDG